MTNPVTGWHLPLLQDCCRKLSRWFSSRINARDEARRAAAALGEKAATSAKPESDQGA